MSLHAEGQHKARNKLDTELFGCISAMLRVTYLTVNTKLDVLWRILWAVQRQEVAVNGNLVSVSPSRSLADDLLTTYSYVRTPLFRSSFVIVWICLVENI